MGQDVLDINVIIRKLSHFMVSIYRQNTLSQLEMNVNYSVDPSNYGSSDIYDKNVGKR